MDEEQLQSSSSSSVENEYENLDLSFDDLEELEPSSVKKAATYDDSVKKEKTPSSYPDDDYILGTLVVRVVAAKDLNGVHQGLQKILFGHKNRQQGSANPYASVRFGQTIQRTSQLFETTNPTWPRHETMYMDVMHPILTKETTPSVIVIDDEKSRESSSSSPHPGDPPKKSVATKSSFRKDLAKAHAESAAMADHENAIDPSLPPKPTLTVAIFHAAPQESQKYNPSKKGDSDDIFLGMASVDLTVLITGKLRVFDEWLPLTGCDSDAAAVRVVCEYEPSDPLPRSGDIVRFTCYCHPADLYPAVRDRQYTVENAAGDTVQISWQSPEGWLSSFVCHRNMLISVERHRPRVEHYQNELASLQDRLSNSPLVHTVKDSVRRVEDDGLVGLGSQALQGGAGVVSRWLGGGLDTVVRDLANVTNWDGRHNPNAEQRLSTASSSSSLSSRAVPEHLPPQDTIMETQESLYVEDTTIDNVSPLPNMPACPITGEPMRDPVVAADGHTYERSAIARWLRTSDKSPLTGSTLPHKNLVPNYMLLSSLQEAAVVIPDERNTASLSSSSSMGDLIDEDIK